MRVCHAHEMTCAAEHDCRTRKVTFAAVHLPPRLNREHPAGGRKAAHPFPPRERMRGLFHFTIVF